MRDSSAGGAPPRSTAMCTPSVTTTTSAGKALGGPPPLLCVRPVLLQPPPASPWRGHVVVPRVLLVLVVRPVAVRLLVRRSVLVLSRASRLQVVPRQGGHGEHNRHDEAHDDEREHGVEHEPEALRHVPCFPRPSDSDGCCCNTHRVLDAGEAVRPRHSHAGNQARQRPTRTGSSRPARNQENCKFCFPRVAVLLNARSHGAWLFVRLTVSPTRSSTALSSSAAPARSTCASHASLTAGLQQRHAL